MKAQRFLIFSSVVLICHSFGNLSWWSPTTMSLVIIAGLILCVFDVKDLIGKA